MRVKRKMHEKHIILGVSVKKKSRKVVYMISDKQRAEIDRHVAKIMKIIDGTGKRKTARELVESLLEKPKPPKSIR